jgi:hypothetical protein
MAMWLKKSADRLAGHPSRHFRSGFPDSQEYAVATIDHIHFSPRGTRVIVIDDKNLVSVLPIRHLRGVVHQANGE